MRFSERVVLVTGGGGAGLGSGLAHAFAREGAAVVLADADAAAAQAVTDSLSENGHRALAVGVDVRSEEDTRAMAAAALEAFGRIDVLVNSAFTSCGSWLLEAEASEWERDVDVILKGTFHASRAVLPAMLERGAGAIVSISSVNAHTFVGSSAYSAAKAGVESLTRNIALEFARQGIRANVVAPGSFRTPVWDERLASHPDLLAKLADWHPLGRVGEVEEIAAAVLYLASDDAAFVTGAVLPVDGGLLSGNPRFAADVHP